MTKEIVRKGGLLLMDFLEVVADAILMKSSSISKLKRAIESLSNEEWFRELYQDPMYCTAIWYNKDLRNLLIDPMNREELKNDAEKAKQFIELVKKVK